MLSPGPPSLILGLVLSSVAPDSAAGSQPASPDRLEITVRVADPTEERVPTRVAFSLVGDSEVEWQSVELALGRSSGELSLPLDGDRTWRVQALADGFWSPSVVVPPGSERSAEITLWPAGRITAAIQSSEEPVATESLVLKMSAVSSRGSSRGPPGVHEVRCPVKELRVEACPAPAGRWNARVQVPGWAPRDLWRIEVEARELTDLGTLPLERGGTVFGRVSVEEGALDPETLVVELRPWIDLDPSVEGLLDEMERLGLEADLNDRGEFQVVGVPAGSFEIIARQPGFSPAKIAPVEVSGEGWTELEEALALFPLYRLTISVDPNAGPFGGPWTLRLFRSEGSQRLRQVAAGESDESGLWRSPPLATGSYELQILDALENSVHWREVVLTPGSAEEHVTLPLIYAEGKVLLGEEPVESGLWFGGSSGAERIETRSDEEGEFLVVLPRDGEWVVDVFADEPPIKVRGIEVEVEPIADLRTADVLIHLPDTRILGEVVDELGLPLRESAQLQVVPLSGERSRERFLGTRTGAGGGFEIVGLQPDVYSVEATTPDGSSDPVVVSVTERTDVSVRLTLRSRRTLKGRVVSETGPVAHALVMAYPLAGAGQRPAFTSPTTHTGTDGWFRMRVPGTASSVRLVVLAPGHALASKTVTEGSAVEIALTREQGTLVVAPNHAGSGEVGFVMVGGQALDLPRLETWARMNGTQPGEGLPLVVPGMPPGSYAYCRLPYEEALLVFGGSALPSAEACREGFLAAGGELNLEAPS